MKDDRGILGVLTFISLLAAAVCFAVRDTAATVFGVIYSVIALIPLMLALFADKLDKALDERKTKRKWRKIKPIVKEIYMDKFMNAIVVDRYPYPRVFHLHVNPYDPDSIKKAEEEVKFHAEYHSGLPYEREPKIYGATWTDKGLIYVAKYVNGEWEVIEE